MGRNYDEILEQWRIITKEIRADIAVLEMPLLDTRRHPSDLTGTFIANLVLQMLSYVAQTEREAIRQRQEEGIAAAKARDVRFGRQAIKLPDNFEDVWLEHIEGILTVREAARKLSMSPNTFNKYFISTYI